MCHGDVLVFASDGVWDNLGAGDVLGIVSRYMTGFRGWVAPGREDKREGGQESNYGSAPGKGTGALEVSEALAELTEEGGIAIQEKTIQAALAVAIAGEAKVASHDTRRESPFGRELKRHYPREQWEGGKVDDICVVVAVVVHDDMDS